MIAAFTSNHSIASGSYLIAANNGAGSSRLKREPQLVSSSMSLPNTKLLLRLRDARGVLIDEVDDFVGAPFAGGNSNNIRSSMERIDLRRPGIIPTNWRTAQTTRGFDLDAPMRGTPGFENGSIDSVDAVPPVDATNIRAYRFSGSLLIAWSPSTSEDLLLQRVELFDASGVSLQSFNLPASGTGVVINDNALATSVKHVSIDESSNVSLGTIVSLQPLYKPIISEVLPDPIGSDDYEWIELAHTGSGTLNLQDWILRSGSKSFMIKGSGGMLQPGQTFMAFKTTSALPLANNGGEVSLWFMGKKMDVLAYSSLPEGVSIGRIDEATQPFCIPTPGVVNSLIQPNMYIEGYVSEATLPVTVNMQAVALTGTMAQAQCSWDYGDGFSYQGCNPPSHAMKQAGDLTLSVEVRDYCGTTVKHSLPMRLLGKAKTTNIDIESTTVCRASSFSGVTIAEVFPRPESGEWEWIELRSTGSGSIDLCGWSLDDQIGGSREYSLDDYVLEEGVPLVIDKPTSNITLNDDHDTVRLIAPLPLGGTGVLMNVPYVDAPEGQSFALRSDTQWLWTQYPTPGTENRFQEVDPDMGASPVILNAALPNPVGKDEYGEWIDLENTTARPQWLNGWHIETQSGKSLSLQGIVLSKKELLRLELERLNFALPNTSGTLRLIDKNGSIRSVLRWLKAKEGSPIRKFIPTTETGALNVRMDASMSVRSGDVQTPLLGLSFLPESVFKIEINNIFLALYKNKKVDLQNYSQSGSYVSVGGVDFSSLALQMGYAYVTNRYDFSRRLEYLAYEDTARQQKRGIWADEIASLEADEWKRKQGIDRSFDELGLSLTINPPSGLASSGTVVSFESDPPASVYIAVGTGSYQLWTGSLVISRDLSLSAFAEYEYQTGSGKVLRSTVTTREYSLLKDRYEPCLSITEVYPSPQKGEKEWVEIYNTCDHPESLLGWQIDDIPDGGSKPFTITEARRVDPHSYIVFSGSSISFNNSNDAARLIAPNKRVMNVLYYPLVPKGASCGIFESKTCISTIPTPGIDYVCKEPTKASKSTKTKIKGIGLRTVFQAFGTSLTDSLMNTNIDQRFSQLEGQIVNSNSENKEEKGTSLTFFLSIFGFFLVVFLGSLTWFQSKR